jgi:hypothetical protein
VQTRRLSRAPGQARPGRLPRRGCGVATPRDLTRSLHDRSGLGRGFSGAVRGKGLQNPAGSGWARPTRRTAESRRNSAAAALGWAGAGREVKGAGRGGDGGGGMKVGIERVVAAEGIFRVLRRGTAARPQAATYLSTRTLK